MTTSAKAAKEAARKEAGEALDSLLPPGTVVRCVYCRYWQDREGNVSRAYRFIVPSDYRGRNGDEHNTADITRLIARYLDLRLCRDGAASIQDPANTIWHLSHMLRGDGYAVKHTS